MENYNSEVLKKIEKLPSVPVGRAKDLTGKKFGHLTVLKRAPKEFRGAYWWCICDCPEHNIISCYSSHLTTGQTQSCGCLNKKIVSEIGKSTKKDLVGNRYGKLVVLEDSGLRAPNRGVIWKCQCDCGNITWVRGDQLSSKDGCKCIRSCGCQMQSLGEELISNLLKDNNITYKKEYTFKDLKGIRGGCLRFDFAIFNKDDSLIELIEFDGVQHFKEVSGLWKDSYTLEERQTNDKLKNEYCKNNNIKLIRIPYTQINNINLKVLELDNIDRF